MCRNKKCQLRFTCFRFMAEDNPYRQSYFLTNPKPVNGKCDDFMPINTAYTLKTMKDAKRN